MVHDGCLAIDATGLVARGKGVARLCAQLVAAAARSPRPHVAFLDASADLPALPEGPRLRYRRVACRPAIRWERVGLGQALAQEGAVGLVTFRERLPRHVARRSVIYLFEAPEYRWRIAAGRAASVGLAAPRRTLYERLAEAYGRVMVGPTLRRAAAVIASSEHTARECRSRYGVARERVAVVYPELDPVFTAGRRSATEVTAARERFAAGSPYILHFASGDARDGSLLALSAFARLAPGRPDIQLVLGGEPGWLRGRLEREALRLGIAARVWFAGFQVGEDLASLYRGALVYLDTSFYEGFGFQPMEAMACGVPVVASAAGSLPEVIGDAGWLVAPGDAEAFAAALGRVLDDEEERREMTELGLERVREIAGRGGGETILEKAAAAFGFMRGECEAVRAAAG